MPVLCGLTDVIASFICTCGRCYCHYDLWLMLLPFYVLLWQMLLPSLIVWLILLPFDMCCCHCVADVIAKVADGIAYHGGCGLWSDVITISGRWNSHWVTLFYLSFSSGLLYRTSSHMWGRWYLPRFLFRDGLLTLMYKASFMVLMRFWSSLPTILKFSMVTS